MRKSKTRKKTIYYFSNSVPFNYDFFLGRQIHQEIRRGSHFGAQQPELLGEDRRLAGALFHHQKLGRAHRQRTAEVKYK